MASEWDVVDQQPARPPRPVNRTSPAAQALAGPGQAAPKQPAPRAPQASAQAMDEWGVASVEPMQPPAAPPRQVGTLESAGRTFGSSVVPVVQTAGLAAAGVFEIAKKAAMLGDALAPLFGLQAGMTQRVNQAQDAIFQATEQQAQSMRDVYSPQQGEEFDTAGSVAGGLASIGPAVLGGFGVQQGVGRAMDVVQRGGGLGEAAVAGGVSGAANVAANLLPVKAGGAVGRAIEGGLGRVLPGGAAAGAVAGGALTGGALGVAGDALVTGASNAALPEGEQFADLRQSMEPAVSGGLGAALGGIAAGVATRGKAKAAGAPARPATPPAEPVAEPTPGTQGSAGAAGTDMAAQRRARAESLPVPFEGEAQLTEGQASRDFAKQRFERETAKEPELGRPLRERAAEQNQTALRNLDALEEFTGAKETERGAAGAAVVDPIERKAQAAKRDINQAYERAREAGDMAEPIDAAPLAQWIEDNRSSAGNAGVIGTAEAELARLGGATKAADGSLVPHEITLNDLEELRKKIVAGGKKDATNAHFAAEINRVIDASTEGKGGKLYQEARAKFRAYQAEFKERGVIRDLIGLKKNSSDRVTAMEKVLERAMRSVDDLHNLRDTLEGAGEGGKQAWREVQGMAMRQLRDAATKNVATDERGNPIVSPAGVNKLIGEWDRSGRLEALFGKKGAETLRDFSDTVKDLFTAPPGAVNTSNTGSVMLKAMADMAASFATTGVPLPLVHIVKGLKDLRQTRKVKREVQQALGEKRPLLQRGERRNPFETPKPPDGEGPKGGGPDGGGAPEPPANPRQPSLFEPKRPPEPIPVGQAKEIAPGRAVRALFEQAKAEANSGRAPDIPRLPVGEVIEAERPILSGDARELSDVELAEWARSSRLGGESQVEADRVRRALLVDPAAVARAGIQHSKQPGAFARAIDKILEKEPTDATTTPRADQGGEGSAVADRREAGRQEGQRVGKEGAPAQAEGVERTPLQQLMHERAQQEASAAARQLAARRARPEGDATPAPAVDPESLIVNPIDPKASTAEKVRQLAALTEANKPIVQRFIRELDAALGTKSGDNVKEDGKIAAKASRPEILARKPWHDVEHIRDSYRFKTVIDNLDQLPEVARRLAESGIEVVKADVDKVLRPKEFGWRIAAFDLRMPNGQLVEYYLPIKELEAAKKNGGHQIFEEARVLDLADPEQRAKYLRLAAESTAHYDKAWQAYLARVGRSAIDSRAALDNALTALSVKREKPSANVPAGTLGAGDTQVPSRPLLADQVPGPKSQASGEPSSATKPSTSEGVSTAPIVASMPAGRNSVAITDRGDEIRVTYRLADIDQLQTSHDDALKPNPKYPQELQPRDRERASSEDQINRIANGIKPELLGDTIKASDGAPIVGIDGAVESGNARTIALRRAYGLGKADAYKQWLIDNAEKFGLNPDDVRKTKRPVLIRQGLQPYDRVEFARRANESSVQSLSDTEQAMVDAKRLPDLSELKIDEGGDFDIHGSPRFIAEFARLAVAPNERNKFMTRDGDLSQQGALRIRNAIFAKGYGDADVLATLTESTDSNVKNITNGLMRVADRVAAVRELQAAGARGGADFVPDLMQAVRQYSRMRRKGMKVEQFVAQGDLAGGMPSDAVIGMMRELEQRSRSPKGVAEWVGGLADEIDRGGDPRQGAMFEPRAEYKVGKLADDLDAQQRFLDGKAKAAGYSSLDEFVAGDFEGFMRAADEWREKNPADVLQEPQADMLGFTERDKALAGNRWDDLRRQLRELDNEIVFRAGLAPDFIEDALRSRKVPEDMKRKRKELVAAVRQARDQAETALTAPTPESLRAAADRASQAEAADKAEQKRLADKAKADAQRDEFTLTGSNRDVDVAAAAGQQSLFEPRAKYRGRATAPVSRKLSERVGMLGMHPDARFDPEVGLKKGWRIFAESELDGGLSEILDPKVAQNYASDQLYLLPPDRGQAPVPSIARDLQAPYSTDLFGNPVTAPKKRLLEPKKPAAIEGDTAAPAGDYWVRTVVGREQSRKLGADKITKASEAAAATRYLYRSAVERVDGIVTDANGKPLGVVGGFKGGTGQASVVPATMLAEAVRIPGAAAIWFSHNHPSGTAQLSRADENLYGVLRSVFEGSGIEPKGLLAVTGGRFDFVGNDGMPLGGKVIELTTKPKEVDVPVIEREQRVETRGKSIGSPADAKDMAQALYKGAPGMALLDGQNRLIAWVPIASGMQGKLKDTGGLRSIYRAVSEANPSAVLLVHGGELDAQIPKANLTVGTNVANALRQAEVRVLDVINAKTGQSAAERGTEPPRAAVYSVAALTGAALAAAAASSEQDQPKE